MDVTEEVRNRMQIVKEEHEKEMRECAQAMARYDSVRQMVTLQGWETFIKDVQIRADQARKEFEGIITAMYLNETPSLRDRFISTKIRLLSFEMTMNLYLWMRESAHEAKSILDKENALQQESTQEGL